MEPVLPLFLAACTFVYVQDRTPATSRSELAGQVVISLAIGWLIAVALTQFGIFHLPGIDPNAGQHM